MRRGLLIAKDVKVPVQLDGLSAAMLRGLAVVVETFNARLRECWVTSGLDGHHGPNSKHYHGDALDFRTRLIPEGARRDIEIAVRTALDAAFPHQFDVVLEKDHLHVEFDPKELSHGH